MAGFMVPCPHPELCGAISHIYGSVESIECLMKTHANLGRPTYKSLLIESDMTPIGYDGPPPVFEGLLHNPPHGLMEHITVISDILRAEPDHARLLHLQSGFLNANYPQVKNLDTLDERYHFTHGETESVLEWIPPSKIIHTAPHTTWGHFSRNGEMAVNLTHALADSFTEAERVGWLRTLSLNPVRLTAISGPLGYIYRSVDVLGAYRVFVARALRLPAMMAMVTRPISGDDKLTYSELFEPSELIISGETALSQIAAELVGDIPQPTIQDTRMAMSGVGAGTLSYSDDIYVMTARTRMPWLMFPESARIVDRAYRRAYPDYESPLPESALASDTGFNEWVAGASRSD